MISPELAQELKAAGFPQSGAGEYLDVPGADHAYAPTLTELIEQCGKTWYEPRLEVGLFTLQWAPRPAITKNSPSRGDCWMATYLEGGEYRTGNEGYGDTMEEAVAQLWLVLNEQRQNCTTAEPIETEVVKRGRWFYDETVPAEVRIVRSKFVVPDPKFVDPRPDEPPEGREDAPSPHRSYRFFYSAVFELIMRDGMPSRGGTDLYSSLEEVIRVVERRLNGKVIWDET
jgi:hypothetical protein